MTITIVYTNYPDIISLITLTTAVDKEFVLSLPDANNITITANDSTTGDTVAQTLDKDDLLDMIQTLQYMADSIT